MTKPELRKDYLERRARLSAGDVASMSRQIADRFFGWADLKPVTGLHTFIRIGRFGEVDTSIIYYRIWRDFPPIVTYCPRTNFETGEMDCVSFDSDTEMSESPRGIREPGGGVPVDPSMIDLILVPMLCFDDRGHRVGYGKGFYDRFLARCRPNCLKIGLNHFPPVASIDDVNSGDVALDVCVTPDRVYLLGADA